MDKKKKRKSTNRRETGGKHITNTFLKNMFVYLNHTYTNTFVFVYCKKAKIMYSVPSFFVVNTFLFFYIQ